MRAKRYNTGFTENDDPSNPIFFNDIGPPPRKVRKMSSEPFREVSETKFQEVKPVLNPESSNISHQ